MTLATQGMIESALASLSADGHSVGFNAVSRAIEAAISAAPPAPAAEPVAWALIYSDGTTEPYMGKDCPSLNATPGIRARPLVWGDAAPPPVEASKRSSNRTSVDSGALQMALNILRRGSPAAVEAAAELSATAQRVEASQQQASGPRGRGYTSVSFGSAYEKAVHDVSRLTAERDALKAEAEALRAAFVDTAKALGCEPDNEAILAAIDALRKDAERLDAIGREYWRIDPFNMPTGAGDNDVGWKVVEYHMAPPKERVVAEVYEDNPRAAIDAALAAQQGGEVSGA